LLLRIGTDPVGHSISLLTSPEYEDFDPTSPSTSFGKELGCICVKREGQGSERNSSESNTTERRADRILQIPG